MGPLITVVTPSLNQGRFLERTIRSVVTQDYPNIEYIILDGGSTDNSIDIIRNYQDRISYWISEPDGGQADALRKGFAMAKGDILCWLNGDDLFLPGACSAVADYFANNPSTHALSGGAYLIDVDGHFLKRWPPALSLGCSATFDKLRFHGMGQIIQPATFWRRQAYEKVGGIDPSLEINMDHDLFIRLAKLGPFGNIRRFVAVFRYYMESKGYTMSRLYPKEIEIVEKRYGMSDLSKTARSFLYWRWRIPQIIERAYLTLLYSTGQLRLPEPL
jgi:glycosyltransferase involved in cell wall biosynthesis